MINIFLEFIISGQSHDFQEPSLVSAKLAAAAFGDASEWSLLGTGMDLDLTIDLFCSEQVSVFALSNFCLC